MIGECERFVNKSAEQIIDSIMTDFNPQETCWYLKMCDASFVKNENGEVQVFDNAQIPDIEMANIGKFVNLYSLLYNFLICKLIWVFLLGFLASFLATVKLQSLLFFVDDNHQRGKHIDLFLLFS